MMQRVWREMSKQQGCATRYEEAPGIGGKNGGLMLADDRAEELLSCYVLVIEKTFLEVFRKDAIIVDVYNLS